MRSNPSTLNPDLLLEVCDLLDGLLAQGMLPQPPEQLAVCGLYLDVFMCCNYTPPAVCVQDPKVKVQRFCGGTLFAGTRVGVDLSFEVRDLLDGLLAQGVL